ncbi:hypothetical protein F4780DRAFT_722748 [Xylariomycetidae sp. FL0641]|nr:hypothetical protein F4780DRAFT_722748 [Xylariomycetidae sp. FL0641]
MEDDLFGTPPPRRATRTNLPRQAKIKTPVRPTRSTAAYFSSDPNTPISDPDTADNSESDLPAQRVLRPRRKRRARPSRAPTQVAKRARLRSPSPSNEITAPDVPRVFPPWATLPYHVWFRVFEYVAEPIRRTDSRVDDISVAMKSLVAGARVCKATLEPALAGLWKCPPFHQSCFEMPPQKAFALFLDRLSVDSTTTAINYRTKVEILRIDAEDFLTRKYNGIHNQLSSLQNLPRLSHLEIYHQADNPLRRRLDTHLRWKLSKDDLMQALQPVQGGDSNRGDKTSFTRLTSWRWNSRLVTDAFSLEKLPEVHSHPSFASLRQVAFVNYQLPSWGLPIRQRETDEMKERDRRQIESLAAAISASPNLEYLVLESSTLANGYLLELLPKTLKHLELVNCWEVVSDDLEQYLLSHGRFLEKLTLKHCQSLSLEFLPVLGIACPNLTHLEADLKYYRHHEHYADNKPEYITLLAEDQVPTWPSSIQSVEIIHMRHWTSGAAEVFFGSLLQNAENLPNLRRLAFKVEISIDWRQRQEWRKALVSKMNRVFKRVTPPPKDFRTLPPPRQEVKADERSTSGQAATRRSTRIACQVTAPTSPESDAALANDFGTGRLHATRREFKRLRLSEPRFDADDEDSEDELSADHRTHHRANRKMPRIKKSQPDSDESIQGLCELVDIQVDNQRPRETKWNMEDFLDSAEESDPEWDGGDVDVFD